MQQKLSWADVSLRCRCLASPHIGLCALRKHGSVVFFFLVRADPPLFACMCAREREQDALYDLSKGNYEIGFNRGVHFTLPFSFLLFSFCYLADDVGGDRRGSAVIIEVHFVSCVFVPVVFPSGVFLTVL